MEQEVLRAFSRGGESRVDAMIRRTMRRRRITGLSLGVAGREGLVLEKGYGFADEANREAATPRTVY